MERRRELSAGLDPQLRPPGGLMAAGGMRGHGKRDALETRPSETVPQRIGRPVPYGEALRRVDMLQQTYKQPGFHRTPQGHSRSAVREFPLGVIPDTADYPWFLRTVREAQSGNSGL